MRRKDTEERPLFRRTTYDARRTVSIVIPPILCYHKIDPRRELGFTRLGPAVFKRQIEAMAKAGYRTLGGADLLAQAKQAEISQIVGIKSTLPPRYRSPGAKHVVLTFDDGYAELLRHAFPVLKEHGYRALVFVITDFVGKENSWDVQYGWRKFQHLDWDDLEKWQKRGIEVHSHGASHARLTWLSDQQVADELGRSREIITSRLGRAPAAISYPFGSVDARIRKLARDAGYVLGFAGPNDGVDNDPMRLARSTVYAWDTAGPPLVLGSGLKGGLARGVAKATNRFAVGTALIQKVFGRKYR